MAPASLPDKKMRMRWGLKSRNPDKLRFWAHELMRRA
jgi:hypothetical protein